MAQFKVQKQVALKGRPGIGRVWETVGTYKRTAVAERLAQLARVDLRHQRPVATRTAPVRIV